MVDSIRTLTPDGVDQLAFNLAEDTDGGPINLLEVIVFATNIRWYICRQEYGARG